MKRIQTTDFRDSHKDVRELADLISKTEKLLVAENAENKTDIDDDALIRP